MLAEGESELLPRGHLAHVRLLATFSGVLKVSDSHAYPILAIGMRSLVSTSDESQGWQRHPLLAKAAVDTGVEWDKGSECDS